MSHSPELNSISNVQKVIDDTVILLLTIKENNDFCLLKKQEIDNVIQELQNSSRSLPELSKQNNQHFPKDLFKIIEKAIHLWDELFNQ